MRRSLAQMRRPGPVRGAIITERGPEDNLLQRGRQRLQLRNEIGAERVDDLDDRKRDPRCDQAVFDRGGAGFIGGKVGQQAFQFHNSCPSQRYRTVPVREKCQTAIQD